MSIRSRRRGVRGHALGLFAGAVLIAAAAPGGWAPPVRAAEEARIANSADGVALRADPAFGAEVLGVLPDGQTVDLRLDRFDTVYDPDGQTRWWPVETAQGEGWVAGFFLEVAGWESRTGAPTRASSAVAPGDGDVPSGVGGEGADAELGWGFAQVSEPDGVNLRAEPSADSEALGVLGYGDQVALRIDVLDTVYAEGTRWWPVAADGVEGWVSGAYLAPPDAEAAAPVEVEAEAAEEPAAPAEPEMAAPSAEEVAAFVANAYVQVVTDDGGGLNIRADGAPDAEQIGALFEQDVVQVMDGPSVDPLGNPWYLITDGETTGWVFGDYLVGADQPPAPDGDEAPVAEPEPEPIDTAGVATGSFMYPVERYTFTQGFGCSPYWFEPWVASVGCNYHNGIDLANDAYTPIMAADGGTVDQVGWCDCGLGYYVRVDHGNGFRTLYGHMAEYPWASVGQQVAKGDVVGPMGSSGNSTGPHLHFIVNYQGVDQDPLWYLT